MQKVWSEPGGVGVLTAVPAGSTNGTIIGTAPDTAKGVRLYLPSASDSVTFALAAAAPVSPPTTFQVTGVSGGACWDEPLNGLDMYITAVGGTPLFRFV